MRKRTVMIALLLLSGCGRAEQQPANDFQADAIAPNPVPAPTTPSPPVAPVAPVEPAAPVAPVAPRVLIEPRGPIDPRSVEAAGQVVQLYGALIEERRFNEAGALWGDRAAAATFAAQFKETTHMEIGDLGETDGAAGSIFTTIPVTFYRTGFRRPADVVLRRVNDVPGSTAAQRRWHIAQIEWKEPR